MYNFKDFIKKFLGFSGTSPRTIIREISVYSMNRALEYQGLSHLLPTLRSICNDLSQQESTVASYDGYMELKYRGLHAFQCKMMLKALEDRRGREVTVVDIGDSAGTHMTYLAELYGGRLHSVSINLDPVAIEKIRAKGMNAIQKRAEDISPSDLPTGTIDLMTAFEMVEHLHNPAIFFSRIAKKTQCNRMLITVPYVKQSRVGLGFIRTGQKIPCNAEQTHIFELAPKDWSLLLLHSGWRVVHSQVYYQYPKWTPLSPLLRIFWKMTDYEGFWGAILEKDLSWSDCYTDWPA